VHPARSGVRAPAVTTATGRRADGQPIAWGTEQRLRPG
jgi:hypothetical protein